jgi:hypothetical protein
MLYSAAVTSTDVDVVGIYANPWLMLALTQNLCKDQSSRAKWVAEYGIHKLEHVLSWHALFCPNFSSVTFRLVLFVLAKFNKSRFMETLMSS